MNEIKEGAPLIIVGATGRFAARAHPEIVRARYQGNDRGRSRCPERRGGSCLKYSNDNALKVRKMMDSIHAAFRREGLVRVKDGRVLGGVIAGLGRRLGIDPWPARLLFLLVLMLIPGSQLLIYPILWILMPEATEAPSVATAWSLPRPE